ncbi:hypothetical protein NEPAR04_1920 [Nematocida parisii]|nr:hypothetical protein NEPAR08_1491 [Nematocida parisii]KAI5130157.1 hypothetical protein NEPAR03_1978 [Nematocida parisii]KAI5143724.1 hypothetical protein NEPAR04_1920 [Nematocida parisii]
MNASNYSIALSSRRYMNCNIKNPLTIDTKSPGAINSDVRKPDIPTITRTIISIIG